MRHWRVWHLCEPDRPKLGIRYGFRNYLLPTLSALTGVALPGAVSRATILPKKFSLRLKRRIQKIIKGGVIGQATR